jgi:hypothetical protein
MFSKLATTVLVALVGLSGVQAFVCPDSVLQLSEMLYVANPLSRGYLVN